MYSIIKGWGGGRWNGREFSITSKLLCSDDGESDTEESGVVVELEEGGEAVDYVYSDSEEAGGPSLPASYEDEEDFDSLLF